MAISIPLVTAAVGLGSSAMSAFGSKKGQAGSVQLPPMWQAPGRDQAAWSMLGMNQGLPGTDIGGRWLPQAEQAASGMFYNPGTGSAVAGADYASMLGRSGAQQSYDVGQGMIGTGQQITGAGQGVMPYGQSLFPLAGQIAQTAFDPQNMLYDRTKQQLLEQTRAGQAARGVAMTPYGAGLEADALRNFNIDWQNNQLQRQISGGGAAGGLVGQGAGVIGQGAGMMGQGAQLGAAGAGVSAGAAPAFYQASMYPYATNMQIGQGQLGATSSLFGQAAAAQNPMQQQIANYLAYLGVGNQAQQANNSTGQLGLNQSNMQFNQGQTIGQNMGSSIYGVGNAFKQMGFPNGSFMGGGGNPNIPAAGFGQGGMPWGNFG